MKYIIRKIEYITNDIRQSEKVNIVTNNLETERKRLYTDHPCNVIYFTYDTKPCDKPSGRQKAKYKNKKGVISKRCTHCGKFYRLKYFYPLKFRRKGKNYETLQSWCKFCMISENCKRVKEKRINHHLE